MSADLTPIFTREIDAQFLSPLNCTIETSAINVLVSLTGTGKTSLINGFIHSHPLSNCLAITHRISLATFLSQKLEFSCYRTRTHAHLITSKLWRWVVSMESLHRFKDSHGAIPIPDILILDEFGSLLEHYLSSTMDRASRLLFVELLTYFLKHSKTTVIVSDAYWNNSDLANLIDLASGNEKPIYIHQNKYRASNKKLTVFRDSINWYRKISSDFDLCISQDEFIDKPKLYVFSNSKDVIDGLYQLLREKVEKLKIESEDKDEILRTVSLITSDTHSTIKENMSLEPDIQWIKFRIVFCSPTISSGVSFDVPTHFTRAYGYAINTSSSPRSFLQQLNRVRTTIEGKVRVLVPEKCESIPQFTFNDIMADLRIVQGFYQKNYTDILEIGYFERADCIVPAIRVDSTHNRIVVRNIEDRYVYWRDYYAVLSKCLERDWFEVKNTEGIADSVASFKLSQKSKTLKEIAYKEESADIYSSLMLDINLCSDVTRMMNILDFYNVFPCYGPPSIRTGLRVREETAPLFCSQYYKFDKQKNFETMLLGLDSQSVLSYEGGYSEQIPAITKTFERNILISYLWAVGFIREDDVTLIRDKTMTPVDLIAMETTWDDGSPALMTKYRLNMYVLLLRRMFEIDETLSLKRWSFIHSLVTNNTVVLSAFAKHVHIGKVLKDAQGTSVGSITASTKIARSILKNLGLTPHKSPDTAVYHRVEGQKKRIRLRTYKVFQFNDRLYLSMCRFATHKRPEGVVLASRLERDPFKLLSYQNNSEGTLREDLKMFERDFYEEVHNKHYIRNPTTTPILRKNFQGVGILNTHTQFKDFVLYE